MKWFVVSQNVHRLGDVINHTGQMLSDRSITRLVNIASPVSFGELVPYQLSLLDTHIGTIGSSKAFSVHVGTRQHTTANIDEQWFIGTIVSEKSKQVSGRFTCLDVVVVSVGRSDPP